MPLMPVDAFRRYADFFAAAADYCIFIDAFDAAADYCHAIIIYYAILLLITLPFAAEPFAAADAAIDYHCFADTLMLMPP